MRAIVSAILTGIFKVLVPLFYILFILAGIACALVTSVIAYDTVQQLFIKHPTVGILSIPLLVVISFEVTKVFIIFLNKQYSDSKNEKYIKNKSLFLFARGLLIGISAILTLLYTFYNLDNPELGAKLDEEKAIINQAQDKQRSDINANYDRQIVNLNANYDNQIQPFKDEMKAQEKFRYSNGEFQGPEWRAANQNVQQLNDKRNQALTNNENERTKALARVETERMTKIKEAETNLKMDNSTSNKMVHSMLSVVTSNPNYSKGFYLFAIFVLSILITIGLEFVIWSSFTVLAINHGDFFEVDLEMKHINEKHGVASDTIDGINKRDLKTRLTKILNLKDLWHKKAKETVDKSIDEIDNI